MRPRVFAWISLLLVASLSTAGAADSCKLLMYRVPVKMEDLRPVISANINGTEARFMVDTGSFFDFLSPAAAAQFKLPLRYAPPDLQVSGVGGSSFVPRIATAKSFTVAGITAPDAQFLVGNNDFGGGIAGILGQNIFRIADIDFDFANGVLRFVRPQSCRGQSLAYWATTQGVGVTNFHWTSDQQPNVIAKAAVNGHRIDVLFDSGSWRSILSLDAAKRAGITPDSPGVIPAGESIGLGDRPVKVWIAPVAKFEIGGEAIERTHVLIGDIGLRDAEMLLGSDFFLAHHIYIAYSQDKIYFTYNGGPVFDLNARPPPQSKTPSGNAASGSAASGPSPGANAATDQIPASDASTDATSFMRRGMADISRGEFAQAIVDLTRACGLEPADADCRFQRGIAYWRSAQPEPALADFNAAIQRQPGDFEAHLARAQVEMAKQPAVAETDLDAVDRLAPQQADLRLQLATLYDRAGEYAGGVHQYDIWIDYHPADIRLSYALSGRCGAEAAANVDVDRALDDCNTALRLVRKTGTDRASAIIMSNRGLAYLRRGQLDRALADLQAALKLRPEFPWARYELGLAELRKGLTTAGRADLAGAQGDYPGLAGRFARMGLSP
jgi:tetratricopeptide (TPR) repeat protein